MTSSRIVDAYYTPPWAADAVAAALPAGLTGRVFDPAVGAGALLSAVSSRFGEQVDLVGMDIDRFAVQSVRSAWPRWLISEGDLLSPRSRAATRAWRAARESLSAVVINPPYSYRGNGGTVSSFGHFNGRVAPSLNFLLEVLVSLDPEAGYFAVLPDGALDAERSAPVWREIMRDYSVERISKLGNSSFPGARVSTSIVQIVRRVSGVSTAAGEERHATLISTFADNPHLHECRCVELIRGRVPVYKLKSLPESAHTSPFLHTTDLRSQNVSRTAPDRLADDAPIVLLGRVGRWRSARLIEVGRVVLSDCIIGVRPRSHAAQTKLVDQLGILEQNLKNCMRGTGAPYLTVRDVQDVLSRGGWNVQVVPAGSPLTKCSCDEASATIASSRTP